MDQTTFTNNEPQSQFELRIGGHIAFAEYALEGNKIYLTHTEVPKVIEGQGYGSELVKKALQHIKKNHLTLIPLCSFAAHYVNNHPEWQSILSEGYQM